ncbi:MAG: hypothetical protein HUU23_17930 [Caldilineales bacterium]|nr:hypothetical protein [Caldilineales bacterium]
MQSRRAAGLLGPVPQLTFLLALLLLLPFSPVQAGKGRAAPYPVEPLLEGADYAAWFRQATGYAPDPTYFGAYAIAPAGDALYLGFGAARPAESDGALLARFDGQSLSALYRPTEQGFIDMEMAGNTLFIPGVDPCCGDGWDAGNVYRHDIPSGATIKYRNLPHVLHTWGLWFDGSAGQLYAATSAHAGDNATWLGAIYRSSDMGASWERIADAADGIGDYRTYDVSGFQGRLYAIWGDVNGACGLTVFDPQSGWQRLSRQVNCRSRLLIFGDSLLAVSADSRGLLVIDSSGRMRALRLSFTIRDWSYNWSVAANGSLYALGNKGNVYATSNLRKWDVIAASDHQLITLSYWPARNWLIAGDRGAAAGVWKIDLN